MSGTGALLYAAPHVKKRPVPTPPSFRAQATGSVNSGTSVSVVIPATAVIGDMAIFNVSSAQNSPVATPAGLTPVGRTIQPNTSVPEMWVYTRRIVAGDPGKTITFTFTGNVASWSVACLVYANCGGVSVYPEFNTNYSGSTPPPVHTLPTCWAGPYDTVLALFGGWPQASLSSTAANPATPSGWTLRSSVVAQNGALTSPRSNFVFERASFPMAEQTVTTNQQSFVATATLALHPVDGSWADKERVPSSLANAIVHAYGCSYLTVVQGDPGTVHITDAIYYKRIRRAMGQHASSVNMGIGGTLAPDAATFAYGSASRSTQAAPTDTAVVNQAGTFTAKATPKLVLTDLLINDIINDGAAPAARRKGAEIAMEALFRLIRSASVKQPGDASVALTGSWATTGSDGCSGGSFISATAPGAKVTITTTEPSIDVVVLGQDDTATGATGAAFTVTVDGTVVYTGTTSNAMKATGQAGNYGFCQWAIPVHDMGPGTHTVVLTHTGSAGQRLSFDCYLVPSSSPPWIVTCKGPELPAAAAGKFQAPYLNPGVREAYNAIADTVAARFPDGRVITYDPGASGRWDTAKAFGSDALHKSAWGHSHYTHEILRLLCERVP